MRPIAPHTIVCLLAASSCGLAALSPRLFAESDEVAAAAPSAAQSAPEQGELAGEIDLSLAFADPDLHLGRTFSAVCQKQDVVGSWNPYLTRFGAADFGALRVWADAQDLWLPEEYEAPLGLLFARKPSAVWAELEAAPAYSRIALTGVVRQVFLDRPWIEVTSARALPVGLGEGALIHASRGVALWRAGQYALAESEFARARTGALPERARDEFARIAELCRLREPAPAPD